MRGGDKGKNETGKGNKNNERTNKKEKRNG